MKKISTLLLLFIASGLFLSSCSKSDDALTEGLRLPALYDVQWKLIAFGEASSSNFSTMTSNNVSSAISPDAANAFLITFKRDSTFTGRSSVNNISGEISINDTRSLLTIKNIKGVTQTEIGDGASYLSRLSKVEYYEVVYKNNERFLRLSYPKDKRYYLEYKELTRK